MNVNWRLVLIAAGALALVAVTGVAAASFAGDDTHGAMHTAMHGDDDSPDGHGEMDGDHGNSSGEHEDHSTLCRLWHGVVPE